MDNDTGATGRPGKSWTGGGGGGFRRPPVQQGSSGDIPIVSAAFQVFPAYLYPPPEATRFNIREVNVTAAANGAVTPIPFTPTIAWTQGTLCALTYYEISVNDSVVGMDVYFRILQNGAPIPGLGLLRTMEGDAAIAGFGDNPYLILPQAGELTMDVTNNSPVAFQVNALLSGWTYPATSAVQVAADRVFNPAR